MNKSNERIVCLVISDSHTNVQGLKIALKHSGADAVIYLGDGVTDCLEYAQMDTERCWYMVKGNCDFIDSFSAGELKKTDSIHLGGKNIVFTHGDLYGVKYGLEGLYALAKERNADIVLFGHTHIPYEGWHDGIQFFNPGTVGGKGSNPMTAGILTIDRGNALFSIMNIDSLLSKEVHRK